MATVYEALRLLAALGFSEWLRIGDYRYLRRGRVYFVLKGRLADPLDPQAFGAILKYLDQQEEDPR